MSYIASVSCALLAQLPIGSVSAAPPVDAEPEPQGAATAPVPAAPVAPVPPEAPAPATAPATAPSPAPLQATGKVDLHSKREEDEVWEPCDDDHEAPEGSGIFLLGIGLFDFDELSDRLESNGYDRLRDSATVIGGEGHAVFENGFVAGARGAGVIYGSGDGPGDNQTHFGGGFGMLDFGFAFARSERLLLTLTGGIGGYGMSLAINTGESVRFDDVLAQPNQGASVGRGGLLVGLTLGFDGRVPTGPVERGRQGFFTIGVRAGGLYGPSLGGWGASTDGEAVSGPEVGLNGGFLALAIGFGGTRQRESRR